MSRKLTRVAILAVLLSSVLVFGVPKARAAIGGGGGGTGVTQRFGPKDSPTKFLPDGTAHTFIYPVPECPISKGCYLKVSTQGWITTHAPSRAEQQQLKAGTSSIVVPYHAPTSGTSPNLTCPPSGCGGGGTGCISPQNLTINNPATKYVLFVEIWEVDFWTSDTWNNCVVNNVYLDPQMQCFQAAATCHGFTNVHAVWDPSTSKAVDFADGNLQDSSGNAHVAYMRTWVYYNGAYEFHNNTP